MSRAVSRVLSHGSSNDGTAGHVSNVPAPDSEFLFSKVHSRGSVDSSFNFRDFVTAARSVLSSKPLPETWRRRRIKEARTGTRRTTAWKKGEDSEWFTT